MVSVTVSGMNGTVVDGLMGLGVNTVTMTVGDTVEAESVTVGMLVCADRLSCSVTVYVDVEASGAVLSGGLGTPDELGVGRVPRGVEDSVMEFTCHETPALDEGGAQLAGGEKGVTVTIPVNGVGRFESAESVYVSAYGRNNVEADEAGTVIVVALPPGELW
jgi:hypothetical protein